MTFPMSRNISQNHSIFLLILFISNSIFFANTLQSKAEVILAKAETSDSTKASTNKTLLKAKAKKPSKNLQNKNIKKNKKNTPAPINKSAAKESKKADELPPIKNIVTECKTELTLSQLIAEPEKWLDKEICFSGSFDSFSGLALDYPPAMRERKKYISLTLLRPKTQIPLGELKLAIKINDAQRHEYLSKIAEGDTVKIKGKVFSAALGEPWVDINQIQVTKGPNSKKNEEESEKENAEYLEGF